VDSPYEILGVDQAATGAQCKSAYYTLAKAHHPDKGGDSETFAKLAKAYNILSDPETREQYDNGTYDDNRNDPKTMAVTQLINLFTAVLDKYGEQEIKSQDLIGVMKNKVKEVLKKIEKATPELEKKIRNLQEIERRLDEGEDDPVMAKALEQISDRIHGEILSMPAQKACAEEMLRLLEKRKYKFDPCLSPFGSNYTSVPFDSTGWTI